MHRVKFRRPVGYWGVGLGGLLPAWGHRLHLRNAPPDDIEFELGSGAIKDGYRFDTADPIWVHVDNGQCPPPGSTHPDIVNIRPTNNRVTVYNQKCSGNVNLRYQLNLFDSSGTRTSIDPIIEN